MNRTKVISRSELHEGDIIKQIACRQYYEMNHAKVAQYTEIHEGGTTK
jgi:hypothetical protein